MSKDLDFVVGDNAAGQLVGIVQRIERLAEEKAALAEDITEVFAEAKGNGFDTKTIRSAIRIRAMDPAKREEAQAMLDLYLAAIGETK